MEVSMDTAASPGLSPLPPHSSYPTSPSATPRKRSIQDTDTSTNALEQHSPKPTEHNHHHHNNNNNNKENEHQENLNLNKNNPSETEPGAVLQAGGKGLDRASSPEKKSACVVEISNTTRDGGSGSLAESTMNTVPDANANANANANVNVNVTPNADTQKSHHAPAPPLSTPVSPSPAGSGTPAAKKRKLSPASKEARERQRVEEKARKEEERAKKEEERRVKEEEKKKRDAEREEERRKKEEKKKQKEEEKTAKDEERRKKEAAKEEEKKKKEEEKLKKERAQPKLNAFFARPKSTSQTATPAATDQSTADGTAVVEKSEPKQALSDYQRLFPDFFLQSHTSVAPPHRFERDADALHHVREKVDASLKSSKDQQPLNFRPSELFNAMPYRRRRGRLPASVKDILLQMQNLGDQPETSEAVQRPHNLLKQIRMKSLRFGEDVRPPYQGTYSKSLPETTANRMMRNPYYRGLPETNYDYDSEAEWDEPEEGEELDSEEEEEMSEDGDDDMDGFLDDDEDHLVHGKRKLIVGDLEPVCSGIQWQDQGVDPELHTYKMETISDSVTFPIDPFSTVYWQKPKTSEATQPSGPGRPTIHSYMGGSSSTPQEGAALAMHGPSKAKRTFPAEHLDEFKQVVEGSDLSKIGVVEILKKRFPKVSKEVLKETLNSVATRVGQKEAEKKWVCR